MLLPLAERVLLGFDLQHIGPVPCTVSGCGGCRIAHLVHACTRLYLSLYLVYGGVRAVWGVRVRACCVRSDNLLYAIGRSEESLNEVHTSGK